MTDNTLTTPSYEIRSSELSFFFSDAHRLAEICLATPLIRDQRLTHLPSEGKSIVFVGPISNFNPLICDALVDRLKSACAKACGGTFQKSLRGGRTLWESPR